METNKRQLFAYGDVVTTPKAQAELQKAGVTWLEYFIRHITGDWGDLCQEDKEANEQALVSRLRILSAYKLPTGEKLWIITEADRSATTILKPNEY